MTGTRGDAALRIELLGGFHVSVGDRAIPPDAWRRSKAAGLVKLLALSPAHRLHREQAMDVLWPELAPAAAAGNLRKALHFARRTVDEENGPRLIASMGESLSLPAEGLWVDVDAWRGAAASARRRADPAAYAEALDLYRDDLLPEDRYEEWTSPYRNELRSELVALLGELAALLEARGEIEAALRVSSRLVDAEPLREEGHLLLIRLHALVGHRDEALRTYERLRGLLESELQMEPSLDAQRLYEEVRAGRAAEPELTADLWERVGELRVAAGDTAGAVTALSRALEVADNPAVAARLHRRAAQALLMHHDAEEAEPHLRAAEARAEDPAERARLVCLRANQAWQRGDLDRAEALAEWARDLTRDVGDDDDLAAAQEQIAIVSHFRGDWRRGLELEIERLHQDDTRGGLPARVFDIHHCIGQYHLYGDGLADGVEEYARRMLALAEQASDIRAQAFAWCLLGESLLLHARWEEAAGCLERSCDLHASLGTTSGALPWQRLAELAVCSGVPEEAEAPLRRASAIATVSPMARHMWGRIYATAALAQIELGRPEAAGRSVRSAGAAAARYGDCPSCSALLNPVAAEALVHLADGDGARAYADAAAGVARMFDSAAWRAMAQSASASVAAGDGDASTARERFEAAAELYDRAGQAYWQERSLAQASSL
jgi:DNA-binding SARP family transcriptional activator